jgi:hypothetical protein
MWRTIVSQSYLRNVAVDTSGYSNNGIPVQVTPEYPGFLFDQPGSRINIPPAPTLENLGAIQAAVQFKLSPSGTLHRFNLAEAFLSFALFVNPDYSIQGTILDATSTWNGATSPAAVVSPDAVHTAILVCDGVNSVQIYLDDSLVAESYTVPGNVRPVGDLGIAVGHWPNPPDVYTFEGTIYEFILLKYDLQQDIWNLLDPCCVDWGKLLAFLQGLGERGIAADQLVAAGSKLIQAANATEAALRGGTKAGTLQQLALSQAAMGALRRRELDGLASVLQQASASFAALDPATQADLSALFGDAFTSYCLRGSDWVALTKLLCLTIEDLAGKGCGHGC